MPKICAKTVNNIDNETYIEKIDYDLYEQRTQIKYGNGTYQKYWYNPQNRKLELYDLFDNSAHPMLKNRYTYDEFSNITSIKNEAYPLANGMGGVFNFAFGYDTLNRLVGTSSTKDILIDDMGPLPVNPIYVAPSGYNLEMEYNNVGGIIRKTQHHERDLTVVPENTYQNGYKYLDGTHKVDYVADSSTSNENSFGYDYNGNVIKHANNNGSRDMYWDEQDRLKAFYDDNSGVYQHYTYDDKGERVIKYGLEAPASLYQNGVPVHIDDITLVDYKMYPNPYVTVSSSWQYTKHYFEGSKRFASRLIDNPEVFKDPANVSRSGESKTEEKTPDTQADFKTYLEKSGLGSDVSVELREMRQRPNLYYLHGDHLGTATFVTNSQGEATQFFLNLPFGETMLEQTDGSYNNPYKFNAKELDEDTGLYYYGARYYNPRLSIWYGVDPLGEKMPNWSPYVHTFDNPIIFTDPDGEEPIPTRYLTQRLNSVASMRKIFPTAWKNSNHGGVNVKEYAFTVTLRNDGRVYRGKNLHTDNLGGSVSRDYSYDRRSEEIIGFVHTHPYSKSEGSQLGVSFSGSDLANLGSEASKGGFFTMVETGTKRYAAIISDPEVATEFYKKNSRETIKSKFDSIFYDPKDAKLTMQQKAEKALKGVFGDEKKSGVSVFVASDKDKKDFKKLK